MRPVQPGSAPRPVVQIAVGVAVSVIAIALPWACGVGANRLPAVVQCQLDALKVLPQDPMMATPYDLVDIVERVKACKRGESDAGP